MRIHGITLHSKNKLEPTAGMANMLPFPPVNSALCELVAMNEGVRGIMALPMFSLVPLKSLLDVPGCLARYSGALSGL